MTPAKTNQANSRWIGYAIAAIGILLTIGAAFAHQARTDTKQDSNIRHNQDDINENRTVHREDIKEIRAMFSRIETKEQERHEQIIERLPRP